LRGSESGVGEEHGRGSDEGSSEVHF
jgi:hypothetical protein